LHLQALIHIQKSPAMTLPDDSPGSARSKAMRLWPSAFERLLARFPLDPDVVADALCDADGHAGRAAGVLRMEVQADTSHSSKPRQASEAVAAERAQIRLEREGRRRREPASPKEEAPSEEADPVDLLVSEGRRLREELQAALAEAKAKHAGFCSEASGPRVHKSDTRRLLQELQASRGEGTRLQEQLSAVAATGYPNALAFEAPKAVIEQQARPCGRAGESPKQLLERLEAALAGTGASLKTV